jgi:Tol biopolymer transport system component
VVGKMLGHYEIREPIGAGGMGEVYRAHDATLRRDVALKVLPPELAASDARLARLEREARALAALNHPNIATIYGLEEADGIRYLVMELVEGETLAERLRRGTPSVQETLAIAAKVAEALEAAHDKGIVHRDVKPGNVMVTAGDRVKLLDFGLAKTVRIDDEEASRVATEADLTAAGTLLGTTPYMSPEQIRSRKVDHRSDIWSFGCLLSEMLTGEPPFRRDTVADTVGAILAAPANMENLPPDTPEGIRSLLDRCLQKDAALRLGHMSEARLAIEAMLQRRLVTAGAAQQQLAAVARGGAQQTRRRSVAVWAGGVAAVLAVVAVLAWLIGSPRERLAPLPVRPLTSLEGTEWTASWSPDGSQVAFSHSGEGSADISVMSVGGGEPHRIVTGPHDEQTPRWSPEGSKIAFLSDRGNGLDVYWVPPSGGPERRLAATNIAYLDRWDGIYALGATPWSPDARTLLFSRLSPDGGVAVWRVDAGSGQTERLTSPPPGSDDLEPSWSFDGESIAFARWESGRASLWVMPAAGGQPRPLLVDAYTNRGPAWTPDGTRIVFFSNRSGPYNLWEIAATGGEPRQLTSGPGPDYLPVVSSKWQILFTNWYHQTDLYAMARDAPAEQHARLTFNTRENYAAQVAADGNRIAYHSDRTGDNEIWLLDRSSGLERRLTDDPAEDILPAWSPDGTRLVFVSNRDGSFHTWIMNDEGGGVRRLSDHAIPLTGDYSEGNTTSGPKWSPDGRLIGYVAPAAEGSSLWLVQPDGGGLQQSAISGVLRFDWYRDSRSVVYVRHAAGARGTLEVYAANVRTGEERFLLRAPCAQVMVAPDGLSLAYVHAAGHFGMNLFRLPLAAPDGDDGLPRAAGDPTRLTDGGGIWHVHGGGWFPDGESLVYTRDTDRGDVFVLEGYR